MPIGVAAPECQTHRRYADVKKFLVFLLLTLLLPLLPSMTGTDSGSEVFARLGNVNPWPHAPPKIGRLELRQEYWNYMKEAAGKYQISPYLIQAVCAIESRYDPRATSGRGACIGLMQLHKGTAKKYGVNPWNPRENIMGGAAVLARLLNKYNGDLSRVLQVYNAECTPAYKREVFKAINQAMTSGTSSQMLVRNRN
jgi:soluble lytic murein transglycosylase-like protein